MNEATVRAAIIRTLDGGHPYIRVAEVVAGFPPEHYNTRPTNLSYSFWHLLEHIRICIDRIQDLVQGETYPPMRFPRDYWPASNAIAGNAEWQATVDRIVGGLATIRGWADDPEIDLGSLARHANGNANKTILFEMIDIAIHTAYHLGEFGILRQVMGLWPEGHR